MSLELLNPHTPEGRELGYLAVRLATVDAERTNDRAGLRKSLERRIAAVVKRATRQHEQQDTEHQRTVESAPMSLEGAKALTELLKISL
jgi:hypothetical protein